MRRLCARLVADKQVRAALQGEMPDEETIKRLIRKGTINRTFVPVTCGSAFKNKGVQPLLDAVVDYLPAPSDVMDVQVCARVLQGPFLEPCLRE